MIENVRSTHYERIGKTIIIYFCKYSVRYNRPALKVVSLFFFPNSFDLLKSIILTVASNITDAGHPLDFSWRVKKERLII